MVRTTINLADGVAKEAARLQRERGIGLSDAVNQLARAGLQAVRPEYHYEHMTRDMGARMDLTNVADVLDILDEADPTGGRARAS